LGLWVIFQGHVFAKQAMSRNDRSRDRAFPLPAVLFEHVAEERTLFNCIIKRDM
jgi:hypothetical protein